MAPKPKTWRDRGSVKLRQAGRRAEQEANAAWRAAQQVTVKDGQTLDQIAQQTGADVTDILDANPDMTTPRTGMVLNVPGSQFSLKNTDRSNPVPGSPEWRARNIGGLPSNAALGGTTTNPGGYQGGQVSMWAGTTPGYNERLTPNSQIAGGGQFSNPYSSYQYRTPRPGLPGADQAAAFINQNILGNNQQPTQPTAARPAAPTGTGPTGTGGLPMRYPGGFMRWAREELKQIDNPTYIPNSAALAVLERAGLIEKTTQQSSGGGGYGRGGRGRGGGGGGRGKGGGGAAQQSERLPAFSQGGGGFGLINWRL